jgi:RHS repeat-associated protein
VWQKKTYYVGNYEMDSIAGSSYPKNIHYIYGGDGIAAIYITQYSTTNMYYVHTDHLGSIDVMTNQSGAAVQYMSFDAWGRRRNHTDWTYTNVPTSFLVSRGYTMHEHLDQFRLINMNGRVYDPVLGRFLEPDNFVQAPGYTQSYNRFSYCWNNPLKYTDPSGYFSWRKFWAATVSAVVGVGVTILTGGNAAVGAWAGAFAGEMIRSGGDVVKSVNAGGKSIFGVALGLGMGQALRAIGGLKAPSWGLLNPGNGRFVPPMNNTISTLANRMTRNINIKPLIEGISNGTLFNAAGGSNFSWVVESIFDGPKRRVVKFDVAKRYGGTNIKDGCTYGAMEISTGIDDITWSKRIGPNVTTNNFISRLQDAGVDVDKSFNVFDFNSMNDFSKNGGRLIATVSHGEEISHALVVKKMVFTKQGDVRVKLFNPDINGDDPIVGFTYELQRKFNNDPIGFVGFKW